MTEIKKSRLVIPKSLIDVLGKNEGFTPEEILKVLELPENKEFMDNLKPIVMELIKKEFPLAGMFF